LLKRFLHTIFIITMLVSQGAEAFAPANRQCSQDNMMMSNIIEIDTYSLRYSNSVTDSSDMNCCAKDCCCPASLLTISALVENDLAPYPIFTATKATSFVPAFTSVFLSRFQRPPKYLIV